MHQGGLISESYATPLGRLMNNLARHERRKEQLHRQQATASESNFGEACGPSESTRQNIVKHA